MNNKDSIPPPIVAIRVKSPADKADMLPMLLYSIELDNMPIAQPTEKENRVMFFEPKSSKKIATAIIKPPKAGLAHESICCHNSPV
ncbi:MAG: hypothetical protein HOB52_08525 [Euryarchaeota archaeon]|nr:hypothetical protein [Euryarchaeota archaeon]